MGMRGKKLHLYLKKTFFFFCGLTAGKLVEKGWGGNRYKLWKNEKIEIEM
jgi:hypothetical protein